jgi:hypothetical protein
MYVVHTEKEIKAKKQKIIHCLYIDHKAVHLYLAIVVNIS